MKRQRLLIVQPYVPQYRVSFFHTLHEILRDIDIDLTVAAGHPVGRQAHRQDGVDAADWLITLTQTAISIGGRDLRVRHFGDFLNRVKPELVIVEQAIKNLDTYALLMRSRQAGLPRVAMWGHGRTYTENRGPAHEAFKMWLTRKSSWFFAYTDGGARYLESRGYPADQITVVKNSTDTRSLRRDIDAVSADDIASFHSRHGTSPGATALFIGGVDGSKGIDFLVEAAQRVSATNPRFMLVIAGEGSQVSQLRALEASGSPFRVLGRLTDRSLATALVCADVLLVPRVVGLVAVDSLCSGVPLVTTAGANHAPEFEYLRDGITTIVSAPDVDSFSRHVMYLLEHEEERARMAQECLNAGRGFGTSLMAQRFAEGVLAWSSGD
jgi:glycosyltransferase involved in cell wall biosynthesis